MKRMYTAGGLLLADLIILFWVRNTDGLAEWYSTHLYPIWVNTFGRLMRLVSFSVIEILLYLAVLVFGVWFLRFLRKVYKRSQDAVRYLKNGLCNLALTASILFTAYVLFCGINYYRDSFASIYGMEQQAYSTKELMQVCGIVKERVQELTGQVERDEKGRMVWQGTKKELQEQARVAMQKLGESYDQLSGYYPRPKGLFVSWILSVQELTGIYSAFSVEANYNQDMTAYNIPFTMCHELSHLKGFMLENEANFIAYLACEQSDDISFQYSGALLGWLYVSNELYTRDLSAYYKLYEDFDAGALADLEANDLFWNRYETKISEVSQKWNDTYLKATKQENGIQSYDRVVDLMIQHYRKDLT